MRELNQQTAQVLAEVEEGATVTVTRNGKPIAVIRPYEEETAPAYNFRTDPMGDDPHLPTFQGRANFAESAGDWMRGFGEDHH